MSPQLPVSWSAANLERRDERSVPPILNIPNEIMNQIAGELPDGAFANFRVAARCIWFITLEAWKDRAGKDKGGIPALTWAAKNNHPYLIRYLFAVSPYMEFNRPWEGNDSTSPLSIACDLGHKEVVRTLVSLGADINYASGAAPKSTPLHCASRSSHHDTVQLLLELGADANALNQEGSSLIHIAAKFNQVKTLRVILDWKRAHHNSMPDVELRNGAGSTAMHEAFSHRALGEGKIEMGVVSAKFMKENAARGRAALPWVVGFLEIGYRPLIISFLNGLVWENGSRPKFTKESIISSSDMLRVAVTRPTLETARVLANHGASFDGLLLRGVPATHLAIIGRDLEALQLFLYKGRDVNTVDQEGSSAVHILAQQTYSERFSLAALIFLEAAGADMFLRNAAGETPKDLAVLRGWPDVAIKTFLDEDFIRNNENSGYITSIMDIIYPMLFASIIVCIILSSLSFS